MQTVAQNWDTFITILNAIGLILVAKYKGGVK